MAGEIDVAQALVNALSAACLYCLIAISFWLVYAPTKTFYISHAAAITFGAYACYWLNYQAGIPLLYASCIATATVAAGFFTMEKMLFRKLRNGTKGWVGLVASIGLYVVLQNCIALVFGEETLLLSQHPIALGYRYGDAYITGTQEMIIVIGGALFVSTMMLLWITKLGRAIRGVASNPDLCLLLGMDINLITWWSIAIGSAVGAAGGILLAFDSEMTPMMGFRLLLNGVIVMIISGSETFLSFVGASLILAITQHLAAFFLDAKWMDAISFTILIAFLIWKPLGFRGRRLKKIEV